MSKGGCRRVKGSSFRIPLVLTLLWGALIPCLTSAQVLESAATNSYETLDSFYTLYQPYMNSISPYQPVFFLPGVDLSKSKFQISFKYRIFNEKGRFIERHPWLTGFYFGYTQTSIWDLESPSLPFADTSYKPELFFLSRNMLDASQGKRGLFLKGAVFHESNGRSGDDSRGINTAYVKPVLVLYKPGNGYGLSIAPKIWGYFSTSENNRDIADYRGYFDIDVKVGKADSLMVSSLFGWAKEGGSIQVDATYPVSEALFNNINIYFHVQYANVLAENLLNYSERTEVFRVGLSFVR